MFAARVHVDADHVIAAVPRRLFGALVEHMGRSVYDGIYEPGHPSTDHDGFRLDVLELVRELGVTLVRYPGGNFVSGLRWEDTVGPRDRRPVRRDLAWHALETNEVGLEEFARWCEAAGCELMYALNLGSRGLEAALDVQEYANHPGGTALSDLRKEHGVEEPYGIGIWCLGNEMDGPWQIGHKTADEYGRLAAETAKALRMADPGIELVACGSSASSMPTFGEWERVVLRHCYEHVDLISCHAYYEELDGDSATFLASAMDMDRFIETVTAIADEVGAELGSDRRINLSFDEWNVWRMSRHLAAPLPSDWQQARPVIEDTYTAQDAVVVGSLLMSLLRHSDRIGAACMAQLVNVIAPIRTEPGGPAWRQSTFDPFAITARLASGNAVPTTVDVPSYDTERFGSVPRVDATVTRDGSHVSVFLVNRDLEEDATVTVSLPDGAWSVREAWLVHEADRYAHNSATTPDRVRARPLDGAVVDGATVTLSLPSVSWAALRLDSGDAHAS